jgi:hypothetical protein
MMKIAVESQNWLSPTAFTSDATHAGPVAEREPERSESESSGVTHVTALKWPFATSLRNCVGGDVQAEYPWTHPNASHVGSEEPAA